MDLLHPQTTFLSSKDMTAPELFAGECHIWIVSLQMEVDHTVLSADEVQRCGRLLAPAMQRRFAASRSMLRRLCAAYTGITPQEIRFLYGDYGKPALGNTSHRLQFNISHTGELALFAFTTDRPVGIDVEEIRPVSAFDRTLKDFCSIADQQWIRDGGEIHQSRRFFRCWTRMEARAKLTGEGLDRAWEKTEPDAVESLRIAGTEFAPAPATVACVAFQGCRPVLSFYRFEDLQGGQPS